MALNGYDIILTVNLLYRSRYALNIVIAKNKETKKYSTYSKFGDIPVNVRIFTNASEAFEGVEHRMAQEYRMFKEDFIIRNKEYKMAWYILCSYFSKADAMEFMADEYVIEKILNLIKSCNETDLIEELYVYLNGLKERRN